MSFEYLNTFLQIGEIKACDLNTFPTGPIDASKTGFMNYSSTVVCAAGTSHPLTIETRDSFNNLAAYRTDQKYFFKIRVEEVSRASGVLTCAHLLALKLSETLLRTSVLPAYEVC